MTPYSFMDELKQFVNDNLLKSNGALNSARMKESFFPPHLWEKLQSVEGTDTRDKLLMLTKGPMVCAGCNKTILPFPKFLNGDKANYCGKSCMPKAKVYTGDCVICGTHFTTLNKTVRTCQSKSCVDTLKRKTSIDRYGVEWGSQSDAVKDKRKSTNVKRYGVEHAVASKQARVKSEATMLKNWGGHNMRNPEFIEAHRDTYAEAAKGAREAYFKKHGVGSPMESENFHRNHVTNKEYDVYRSKDWWQENYIPYETSLKYLSGLEGAPSVTSLGVYAKNAGVDVVQPMSSARELMIGNALVASGLNVTRSTRVVISPYELDIYLPEHKLAIEVNGSFWHTENYVHQDYHLMKTRLCAENGIRLIHVWDWDNVDIVISGIKHACGISEKIHARKCAVSKLDSATANDFCKQNHIQGKAAHSHAYGLYQDGELVMVATFMKPRFSDKYDWEIVRMCSKLGTHVNGGASKLLKTFQKNHDGSLISYSRLDKGYNTVYSHCGLIKIGESSPGYVWFGRNGEILNRYRTQKSKLRSLIGDKYDPDKTEVENMQDLGYRRIWDCGNEIWGSDNKNS